MNENLHVNYRGLDGPGNFIDMDTLEVGNGDLTVAEQQSHFAIWAAFKSTLLASTNLDNPSKDTLKILLNRDLLAINQDDLAKPATLVQRYTDDYDIFAGPLAGGDIVVILVDQSNTNRTLNMNFAKIGVAAADVTELWTGTKANNVTSYSGQMNAHGNLALRLSNIKTLPSMAVAYKWYEAEKGTHAGDAKPNSCSICSGKRRVAFLCGNGASFTIKGVAANATTLEVAFDYINAQYSVGDDTQNVRGASISVSRGPAPAVGFPLSGYNYNKDIWKHYLVHLTGFQVGNANNIEVSTRTSKTNCAPDFDRIWISFVIQDLLYYMPLPQANDALVTSSQAGLRLKYR